MNTKYFPIASFNLSQYFRTGLVTPTNFILNRNEDIQNNFNNSLLFSSEKHTNETDCSLEIVLTNEEYDQLNNISNHYSLFDSVLPISRVKTILFKETSQKDKTVWNIRDGAAFIPDNLIVISENGEFPSIEEIKKTTNKVSNPSNFKDKLVLFDRLMGGFALMRLGGESWMNYSENYFPTISLFNQEIKKEWEKSTIPGENKYEWLILKKDIPQKKSDLFAKEAVYSDVTMSLVEKYAKEDKIILKKNFGILQLDSIEAKSFTYLAAILEIFSDTGRKKIDDFITFLMTNEWKLDRKEGVALMFGLNKGYKTFRNHYKTDEFEVDVKFRLDTQLDYYIIESIYQYVFNNISNSSSFPYLDKWCSKSSHNLSNNSKYETDLILDQIVIYKKKVAIGSSVYFQELYQNIFPNKIYSKIIQSINGWMPPFFKTDKIEEGSQFFEDELKKDIDELIQSIFDNIQSDLIEMNTDETNKLKKELKILHKKFDELVLVNKDLLTQLNEDSKENESFKDATLPYLSIKDKNKIEGEKENNSGNTLFSVEDKQEESQNLKNQLEKRKNELESLKIDDLRITARNLGISNPNKFKGDKQGKQELANEIIILEFPNTGK